MTSLQSIAFVGAEGNRLVGDVYRSTRTDAPPVLLLHGGGQTRHAWRETGRRLAEQGIATAIVIDQRGHGDSDWSASGSYGFDDFAQDLVAVTDEIARRYGRRPVLIGASLGGIAGLLSGGEADRSIVSALVLVDVTPHMDPAGLSRILAFMGEHLDAGFATINDAADAVAAYLPHRPRPKSLRGLERNLRLHPDGRLRWHWDPRFLTGPQYDAKVSARLVAAARRLTIPVLLVRGRESELVADHHARQFLDVVPGARYADVAGASHMVAGDRNDAFADTVIDFLTEAERGIAPSAEPPA
jgi:pimeloyl-ACP methyl ester carboxylesterase